MNPVKLITALIFGLAIFFSCSRASFAGQNNNLPELLIFYTPSCHKCIEAKTKVLPVIEKQFLDKISFVYLDVGDVENYKRMLFLKDKHKQADNLVVPVFFLQGNFFAGSDITVESLNKFIIDALLHPKTSESNNPVDLKSRFKTFTLLAIMGVGLVDGINPCAFTVIVFFISFLALQGYRRRELVAIGSTFILTVFITYLFIGLGVFGFLYRMSHFWILAKIFNILIGIFSIGLASFALLDFIKFKMTGKTQDLALQLPQAVKNQIHKVIGMHYRLNKNIPAAGQDKRQISRLIIITLITGFIVSLLEAVCTGQTYLPTITFILKTSSDLKGLALFYLLVYNFMFVVPLVIIFIFALRGATSENFASFMKKRMLLIKAAMAIIFFILGIYLIWRA